MKDYVSTGPTDLGQCQGAQMYDCSGSTGTPQNPGYSGQVGSACVNLCLAPDGVTCGTCYEPLAVCKAVSGSLYLLHLGEGARTP